MKPVARKWEDLTPEEAKAILEYLEDVRLEEMSSRVKKAIDFSYEK